MSAPTRFALALPLLVLVACSSGGGTSTPAPPPAPASPKLTYTDPAGGSYRLVRNPGLSTDAHLVLDLVGPTGTKGRGIVLTFDTDAAKVAWTKPASSDPQLAVQTAFDLGQSPRISRVKAQGGELQAAFAQKGSSVPAKDLAAPLVRVALDMKAGAAGAVTLSASKAQVLPETGAPVDIQVAVGDAAIK